MKKRSVLLGFIGILISMGGLVLNVLLPQLQAQAGGYMIGGGCLILSIAIMDNIE